MWPASVVAVKVGATMARQRDQDLHAAIGARLAELRRQRQMTQEQLAEAVGVETVTVSRLETGRRGLSLSSLARFADTLEVSFADLLDVERELPAPTRPEREQELLVAFRRLDERHQKMAVEVLKAMVRSELG